MPSPPGSNKSWTPDPSTYTPEGQRKRPEPNFYQAPGPHTSKLRERDYPYSTPGSSNPAFEVSIGSLDEPELTVQAMFRPAELSIDQSVQWAAHTTKNRAWFEFSGAVTQGASVELFLDASEYTNGSVAREVQNLARLARPRVPGSPNDKLRRPHHCVLVFGNVFPQTFRCVIESLATKYTRFSPFGEPVRATVTIKLKEADWLEQPPDRARPPAANASATSAGGTSGGENGRGRPPTGTDADWECL